MPFEVILLLIIIIVFDLIIKFVFYKQRERPSKTKVYKDRPQPPPLSPPPIKPKKKDWQFTKNVQDIIFEELNLFSEDILIDEVFRIPSTRNIPIQNPKQWLKIYGIICCFVDMKGSTKLSANLEDKDMAKAYRLFTETAVRIFHEFKSPYIDVKGDGVFALFDSDQPHRALAATISFKTFVYKYFTPMIWAIYGQKVEGHFGIDQADVLVRKLGYKIYQGRTDRQNEVWAGQPINMAAKLASSSPGNEIWMSSRFFESLKIEKVAFILQWEPQCRPLDDNRFSFKAVCVLSNNWSDLEGESNCRELMRVDNLRGIERLLLPMRTVIDMWKLRNKPRSNRLMKYK